MTVSDRAGMQLGRMSQCDDTATNNMEQADERRLQCPRALDLLLTARRYPSLPRLLLHCCQFMKAIVHFKKNKRNVSAMHITLHGI